MIALMYLDKLSEVGKIILPEVTNFNERSSICVRTPNRKKFFQKLNSQGMSSVFTLFQYINNRHIEIKLE